MKDLIKNSIAQMVQDIEQSRNIKAKLLLLNNATSLEQVETTIIINEWSNNFKIKLSNMILINNYVKTFNNHYGEYHTIDLTFTHTELPTVNMNGQEYCGNQLAMLVNDLRDLGLTINVDDVIV